MDLNILKCNHPTPLGLKGLNNSMLKLTDFHNFGTHIPKDINNRTVVMFCASLENLATLP